MAKIPVSRRVLIALAGLAVLTLAAAIGLWQVSEARCLSVVSRTICRVETSQPLVALSFDDGPTPLGVHTILPLLARHGAHATFFLIGDDTNDAPELVGEIARAGDEVGNHSYTHQRMVLRPMGFYRQEIARTQALLIRLGAPRPTSFRPPYGKKLIGLALAVKAAGLRMVLWDDEGIDRGDPKRFAEEVVRAARPGSIILIHAMYDPNATARAALPAVLNGLDAKGLKMVSVKELLERAGGEREGL